VRKESTPATGFSLKTTSKKTYDAANREMHASDGIFIENHIKENLRHSLHFATSSVVTLSTTIFSPRFRIKSARSPRYTGSEILSSVANNSASPSAHGNPQTPASLHARTTI
jgi:hypothetical protein